MRWSLAAAVLAMVLVACGGDDAEDDGGDASATTVEPEGSEQSESDGPGDTEPLTPEDEVLAAYEEAKDAMAAAFAVPDPEHPDLLAHWGKPALTHLQVSLENYELNGHANIGEIENHDPVVRFDAEDPDVVWVTVCMKDMSYDIDAESREPIAGVTSEEDALIMEVRDRLQRIDGAWVVMETEEREIDGCTPG